MTRLEALRIVLSGSHLARSLAVMALVGTVLNLINQGDALLHGAPLDVAKIVLTYATPFCVTTYSNWATLLSTRTSTPRSRSRAGPTVVEAESVCGPPL